MIFNYTAKDPKGKSVTGIVEAATQRAAAGLIREKSLVVVAIVPESEGLRLDKIFGFLKPR